MGLISDRMGNGARLAGAIYAAPAVSGLLAAAGEGDGQACHVLGVGYCTGPVEARDLIEAHKWFNLGAMYGCEEAGLSRADIAAELNRGQIAEAQRRAREWLGGEMRRAA